MWRLERRAWGAILASKGRAFRTAAQVRNYAPSSMWRFGPVPRVM
jgi:hypothetical protein